MFHKINMEKWPRKEWFVHYTKEVPCAFSTVSLIDITHIKKKGYGVYPVLLWALSATVNKFEEFRTCKDKDPWTRFTGFNLNLPEGGDYFLPIFTAGRYEEQNGRITLPLAVQVHHAVCDGYHAGAFLRALQETLDAM